eukprot:s558_g21.t1
MAKPTEPQEDGDVAPEPLEPRRAASREASREGSPRRVFASSSKELDEISEGDVNVTHLKSDEKEVNVVESYFPGTTDTNLEKRRTMMSERSDRFSYLSVQRSETSRPEHKQNALPPLLVVFACFVAAFLGLVVAGLHDMIKLVGCPLGINGCNTFSGEDYEKKGYLLLKALDDVPPDVIFIVMAFVCLLLIGIIADTVPENFAKQILGGGTVQSLLAVAAGVPIPFKCALLRVLVTALYFVGGGTQGGDGPIIQVCTSLACMIGWTCGIRAPRTQSLLASLGFCCGFASSFNAPLSGILFAIEELSHVSSRLTTRVICIILIGSIVSTAVMRGFLGNKTLFKATHSTDLESMVAGGSVHELLGQDMWMLISACVGLISALVGFVFSRVFHYVHKFMNWIPLPRWLLFGIVGGLVACIGSAVYHATGLPRSMGDVSSILCVKTGKIVDELAVWQLKLAAGYTSGIGVNSLKLALEQDFQGHAGYLLIFALGKLAAFALSVSLRFPGDTLEPVLIAGAFLGGAIGKHLPNDVVGESNSPCVIFGMVGLFASCFRFPLTPVVIVLELTGTRTYNIILPVALSSFTALAVSNHLFPPILEQILHQDDIDLEAVADLAEMAEEEEELMQQHHMQRASSVQSLSMSEASGISMLSKASKGPLGGLVNRLEDSMMDVSSRRRRSSQFSMASSRSGRHGGRGIRRLSMNSRMSAASRASSRTGTESRSPRMPENPKAKKRHSLQDSPEPPAVSAAPALARPSAVSPTARLSPHWSLEAEMMSPMDEPISSEDEVPKDRPGIAREHEEIEEVEAETAAVCCDAFPT